MDYVTLRAVLCSGEYELAVRIKSKECRAEQGLKYKLNILEPAGGEVSIYSIDLFGPGKFNMQQDFFIDGILFFKDRNMFFDVIDCSS